MTRTPAKAAAAKKPAAKRAAKAVVIQSIKGFDSDLKCRGFAFEIGKTYEHDGAVVACESGFHACSLDAHPLEVFGHYPPAGARYCLVDQSGKTDTDDKIKIASTIITIGCEISISDLTKRAIKWVFSRSKKEAGGHATGIRGAASATGYQGAASATGDQGAASATGIRGAAFAAGYEGKVQGSLGNALFALERDRNGNIISDTSGIVGKDGIKANTWYLCRAGKLVRS